MSTNAFETAVSHSSIIEKPEVISSGNSFHVASVSAEISAETKLMWGGGIILGAGLLFMIISNFGGNDMKASLSNKAPTEEGEVQKTEIVYKDQYGNILTAEQVQKILNPSVSAGAGNVSTINTNTTAYPEITLTDAEKNSGENVNVDLSKQKLYVKQGDAQKLLAENRLVKKIVDNRPMYVEPITGAVVELIQAIERPIMQGAPAAPMAPLVKRRGNTISSTGEVTRINNPSSAEIGRVISNPSSAEIGR